MAGAIQMGTQKQGTKPDRDWAGLQCSLLSVLTVGSSNICKLMMAMLHCLAEFFHLMLHAARLLQVNGQRGQLLADHSRLLTEVD